MTEKIHDLKTMLDALHIKQAVSFDDCSALFKEVADKSGMTPPPFELSGNQWCALVNLAVARFTTPPNVATPLAAPVQEPHSDDIAVDRFSAAMKAKLEKQRSKGYGGWDDPEQCPADRLQKMLVDHIAKGDPVDVGNFAMMLWNRGERATPPAAHRQWVGLTHEEIMESWDEIRDGDWAPDFYAAIDAKLREKNT